LTQSPHGSPKPVVEFPAVEQKIIVGRLLTADPLKPVIDSLHTALDKLEVAEQRANDKNDAASDKAMRDILKRLPSAVDKLCLEMYWNKVMAAGFVLIFGCSIGFGIGWYFGHDPWVITRCDMQDGANICSGWMSMPISR
jgi:hypothetical protein